MNKIDGKDGVYLGKSWMSFEASDFFPRKKWEPSRARAVVRNGGFGDGFIFEGEQVIERCYLISLKMLRCQVKDWKVGRNS